MIRIHEQLRLGTCYIFNGWSRVMWVVGAFFYILPAECFHLKNCSVIRQNFAG